MKAPSLPNSSNECLNVLVLEIAKVMVGKVFCRDVYPLMTVSQRAHLWALRNQALFGDAPDECIEGSAQQSSMGENQVGRAPNALTMSVDGQIVPLTKPRWYEFTKCLYYKTWVGLRGTISLQVAAETFCSEFFYLLKLYPAPSMLPVMDAVLRTANARAAVVEAESKKTSMKSITPKNGFYLRGCYDDPAAIAFLWLCRAYCIPCEAELQPISANHTLRDRYPFYVKSVETNTVVAEPLAAFSLCVELYLPNSEHWFGVLPGTGSGTPLGTRAAQKSMWLEYMQFVLSELREPLLRFIRGECEEDEYVDVLERGNPLLQRYQKDRVKLPLGSSRRSKGRNKLLKRMNTGLARYERFARHYYATHPCSVVSVAELFVAAYAYVVCANPLCDDVIPLQEAVPSSTGRADAQIPSRWSRQGSYYSAKGGIDSMPAQVSRSNVLISGVSKECQEVAALILNGASNEQSKSLIGSHVSEIVENSKQVVGEKLSNAAMNFLGRHQPWINVECRTNMLATEVIDSFIRNRCRPLQPKLGELLSHVWCMANEQCEGFPFIVLNRDLRNFVTTLTGHTSSMLQEITSRGYGGAVSTIAQVYWEKLREVFNRAPTSSESRMYHNYTSKM